MADAEAFHMGGDYDSALPSQVYVVKRDGDPLLPLNFAPWRGNPFGNRDIEVFDSGDSRLDHDYLTLVTQVTTAQEPFPAYIRDKEYPSELLGQWHAFTGSALHAQGFSRINPRRRASLDALIDLAAEKGLVHSKKQGLVPIQGSGGRPRIAGTIYQEGGKYFGLVFTAHFTHQQLPMFSPEDDPFLRELIQIETPKDFRFFTAKEILNPDEHRFTPWTTLYASHVEQERSLRSLLNR